MISSPTSKVTSVIVEVGVGVIVPVDKAVCDGVMGDWVETGVWMVGTLVAVQVYWKRLWIERLRDIRLQPCGLKSGYFHFFCTATTRDKNGQQESKYLIGQYFFEQS